MTREEFIKIFDENESNFLGDGLFEGMKVLREYTDRDIIKGLGTYEVYSLDVDTISNNIARQDAIKLATFGWRIDTYLDCLCFMV